MSIIFVLLAILIIGVVITTASGFLMGEALKEKLADIRKDKSNPYGSLVNDYQFKPRLILVMEPDFENYSDNLVVKERVKEAIDFLINNYHLTYSTAKTYIFYEFTEYENSLIKAWKVLNK